MNKPYLIKLELYDSHAAASPLPDYYCGDRNVYPIDFILTAQGEPFVLPDGATVYLCVRRPDGVTDKAAAQPVDAEAGRVRYTILGSEISVPGTCKATVEVVTGDKVLTWTGFRYRVLPSLSGGATQPPAEDVQWKQNIDTAVAGLQEQIAALANGGGTPVPGTPGYSVSITESPENSEGIYRLDIHNENPAVPDFSTPNLLSGTSGTEQPGTEEPPALEPSLYGVRFEGGANTGETVTRLHDAVGLTAGVGTNTVGAVNDFDSCYPWSERRRCCGDFDENGQMVINAYQGEPGYAVDGSNGEVWVETPVFWYKHTYNENDVEEIIIASQPVQGFLPSPSHIALDGSLCQKAYTAAYPMATVNGRPTSRSGVFSNVHSLDSAMAAARALGDRYTVTTSAEWYTKCLLMWVEFATRNLQNVMSGAAAMPYSSTDKAQISETAANRIVLTTVKANAYTIGQTVCIGTGSGNSDIANNRVVTAIETVDGSTRAVVFDGAPVNITAGDCLWSSAYKNGSCDAVWPSSGSPASNTTSKNNCIYRGEETPYGNAYEWVSDVLIQREGSVPFQYPVYYLPDATRYNGGAITPDYVKLNYLTASEASYVKKLGQDSRYPHVRLPSALGAEMTTYHADYYYPASGLLCGTLTGGYWNDKTGVGPSAFRSNSAPSKAEVFYRARLSYRA